ncbi:branched-chain amino acid ABC transporter permease [Calderihabitans maritimus]|uniref:Amino acid ABC transporter permease n=1 Tax=Calderihabitans maritimus TaxID=1246530 RepID=A0A1Z5HRM7_9FIRM|nr:branched-chain amino acid ABC transporter permease [Calderihabitans maritimus]GAW91920.1 amino acid ABC transporter permease [Calderihabitans maritimus]
MKESKILSQENASLQTKIVSKGKTVQGVLLFFASLALVILPYVVQQPFYLHVFILIFLYAVMGGAWNILGGYTGQVSLGHAVYFGIGAYASTMLMMEWQISPWLGMLIGMILAVLVSLAIGYPTFRLKGHYFAIATLALGEIFMIIFSNWEWVGAAVGLYLPILPSVWINFQFTEKTPYYYIALGMLGLTLLVTRLVEKSRLGYYFRAIKNDQDAAKALGINTTYYKMVAMAISAALMAMAGTFYAQYVLYIDPNSVLAMSISIQACLVAVMGGVGTLWGPVIGAAILVPLSEFTRSYLGGSGSALDLVVYGVLIMLIAVFQPAGLMGLFGRNQARRKEA